MFLFLLDGSRVTFNNNNNWYLFTSCGENVKVQQLHTVSGIFCAEIVPERLCKKLVVKANRMLLNSILNKEGLICN